MSLNIGTQLGSHEITALLGKGGMGEVYSARDTKLKREVAIKILPEEFSRDAERVSRFQREAEVLASLNHPNIAAIYDLQEDKGTRFLVLELVDGETLAERIQRGPIPIEEALNIAKHICEALEAAHAKGVIHRDLKPANIKITPGGRVKVLDFGLAKVFEVEPRHPLPEGEGFSNSPTLMTGTGRGVILGTAAYMSPEQARGKTVDRTSDIWAFGCVLYEMLTGTQPFTGETITDILAGIVKMDPDWTALPEGTPSIIRSLLRRTLQKDRNQRLRDIGDGKIEIEEALAQPPALTGAKVPSPARNRKREWAAWALAAVAIIAFAVVSVFYFNRPVAPETYLQVVTPPTFDTISMAISPDGRKLVFVGANQGRTQLFLRSFDSANAQPLAGTDGASYPFWSPDSRSVGFFAENKLKRIDVPGGAVQALANTTPGRGGAWSPDGTILFSAAGVGPLYRVEAIGGPIAEVTHLDSPRTSGHLYPSFLPDGRHFLFYAQGSPEGRGVYWGDLESKEIARLFDADTAAVYSPSGYLVFARQGNLFAQRFDAAKRQLLGDPFTIAEQATLDIAFSVGAFSAGANVLAYRTGASSGNRQLQWFDRSGKQVGVSGPPDGFASINPDLSPAGDRVALGRTVSGNQDIWILEPTRQLTTRFTFDPDLDQTPVWSPDGSQIVFSSNRKGNANLYLKSSSGAGTDELLLETRQPKIVQDWSRNGRFIIYRSPDPKNGNDLWVLPLSGDRKPFPLVVTPFTERDAQFSSDVRWVAYQSDESGHNEIYVQPFPGPGGKWQVSNAGGTQPRWNRNGKELFYVADDGKLMSVPIETKPNDPTLKASPPIELFPTRILEINGPNKQQYAVSPDGQRFLVNVPTESATVSPITVVLNWKPASKK